MADEFDVSGFAGALGSNPTATQSGVNANNLGNIRPQGKSTGFVQTQNAQQGLKDIDDNLKAYGEKHGIDTLRGVISRWSPPNENDTESLIKQASKRTGLDPDEKIDLNDPVIRHIISGPIILQEKGLKALLGKQQNQQQTITQSSQDGAFDVSGFQNALIPQANASEENSLPVKTIQKEQINQSANQPQSDADVEAQVGEMFSKLPGVKQTQAFMMGAGKNISDTGAALHQLVGKAVGLVDPETGEKISQAATENALMAKKINAPYEKDSPIANAVGNIAGAIGNPVNKLIPGVGATSLMGNVIQGIGQGAAMMGLTTPVTDTTKPFSTQKLEQMAGGAVAGGIGGGIMHITNGVGGWIGQKVGQAVDAVRSQFGGALNDQNIGKATDAVLQKAGIDASKVPVNVLDNLKEQATQSLKTGDVSNLQRYADATTLPVPVPMLRGQVTRDPMQYAVEQNLRGIQGVGEPITQVLTDQNKALIANLDKIGAEGSQDITSGGHSLSKALKSIDDVQKERVNLAYKAFKDSTGRDLDVPLQGLAQDYAKTISDFGDSIPASVRNKFESYGLMSGKLNKVFNINEAEDLISLINKNYDPSNLVQARALNQLRGNVQNAIQESGQGLQGDAAQLAKAARDTARQRFQTIDSIPALEGAIRGGEPDKFIQKYVLQGNVDDIGRMTNYLKRSNPAALDQLRSDVMGVIKSKTLNNVSPENATFSQAQLKNFLSNENAPKLARILAPEQMGALRQLNRTAENALYKPATSAVNSSNTAAANANINNAIQGGTLNDILNLTANVPGLTAASKNLAQKNQARLASDLIKKAINPTEEAQKSVPLSLLKQPGIASSTALRELVRYRNQQSKEQQ